MTIAARSTKHVYTIAPDLPFLDALADVLWQRAKHDIFTLSQNLILLPTRRACRAMHQIFLQRTGQQALLLPRMQPLGDIDEDEFYFTPGDTLSPDIPPAVTPLRRQMLLTQLVSGKDPSLSIDQAAQLADALGRFLDQVQIEGCDLGRLPGLVSEREYAVHWQETVQFLDILTQAWPALLQAEGCIDPADRRNRVLRAQADSWRRVPPSYPVIAAGSTGSIPATAELLAVIAGLENGVVILPGLDQQLDETAWQQITDSHPQFGMKSLLGKMDVPRDQVRIWKPAVDAKLQPRLDLLRHVMRPADVTDDWQKLPKTKRALDIVKGLTRIELDHVQEEAQAIALIMRQTLEIPGKTAALVTPDRDLADRVCAALRRWDITVNDSAGTPLSTRPVGAFLRDILQASHPDAGAVPLLSLLKHPLAACGLAPVDCRQRTRELEITVWRNDAPLASSYLDDVKQRLRPLSGDWHKLQPLSLWIERHIAVAEAFAASDLQSGAERLWRDDAGEAAAEWLDDWRRSAINFPHVTGDDYASLCAGLMRNVTLRPAYGQHPRLNIFGLIEARLIHADTVILGGLNEGVWPPEPPVDPWMSRPMKQEFGLPSPERRIGLAAHDFVQLAANTETVLTRARRVGNAPAVPSRFILQLDTVLRALGLSDDKRDALAPQQPWRQWAQNLDNPHDEVISIAAPEPRPPLTARPKQLSVTEIAAWRSNPYAIYAKHILKLRKLNPLDAALDAADRGNLVHEALDRYTREYPNLAPQPALMALLAVGKEVFAPVIDQPEVAAFWWPRFRLIAKWLVAFEAERRAAGIRHIAGEASGKATLGNFTLTGRADRIDRLADATLSIVDYKTGFAPSHKMVQAGHEPQLPLLALIAQQGGFKGISAAKVAEIAYWKLGGSRDIEGDRPIDMSGNGLVDQALNDLQQLIAAFAEYDMPYRAVPVPGLAPHFDDYAHLARLSEWGRTEGEE
jgi:ATP-dependent helicase/nuclease subunit B